MVYSEDMKTSKEAGMDQPCLLGFEEEYIDKKDKEDKEAVSDVDDKVSDQIDEDVVEEDVVEEDERTTKNKTMWNVLHECLHASGLQWTDVARQLNVPISTINSRRKYGRDIEFGFLASLLDMLGCTLRLTVPVPTGKKRPPYDTNALTHALRGMLRIKPTETQSLLQYEGTRTTTDLFDALSTEDKKLVHDIALRLKNGNMSDNDMRQLYAPANQKKGKKKKR